MPLIGEETKEQRMSDGFEQFWKLYPKKCAKGDARKAWSQMAKVRPPLAQLLKAVVTARSCEQWRRNGGEFIPYPATWLRGERWEDVHEVELDQASDAKPWDATVAGIERMAAKLGFQPWDGRYQGQPETWQQWAQRVRAAANPSNVVKFKAA